MRAYLLAILAAYFALRASAARKMNARLAKALRRSHQDNERLVAHLVETHELVVIATAAVDDAERRMGLRTHGPLTEHWN